MIRKLGSQFNSIQPPAAVNTSMSEQDRQALKISKEGTGSRYGVNANSNGGNAFLSHANGRK